jgi:hypothetical protein
MTSTNDFGSGGESIDWAMEEASDIQAAQYEIENNPAAPIDFDPAPSMSVSDFGIPVDEQDPNSASVGSELPDSAPDPYASDGGDYSAGQSDGYGDAFGADSGME